MLTHGVIAGFDSPVSTMAKKMRLGDPMTKAQMEAYAKRYASWRDAGFSHREAQERAINGKTHRPS